MFIDIHSHISRTSPMCGNARYISAGQLIERYDALGVECGVILPLIGPECFEPQSNEDVLDACSEYPKRLIPFCSIHPQAAGNSPTGDFSQILQRYKQLGCKGVGELTANIPLSSPLLQNLFRQIEEASLPVTLHLSSVIGKGYGVYDEVGFPQLEQCLARFPKLMFIAHAQAFWAEISALNTPDDKLGYPSYAVRCDGAVPKLMRRYPNLYGDLSAGSGYNALARDPEYAVAFLSEFQDRLLFGLDIGSVDTPTPLVGFLLSLLRERKITQSIFNKVARENTINLLGI